VRGKQSGREDFLRLSAPLVETVSSQTMLMQSQKMLTQLTKWERKENRHKVERAVDS
jgi:hypothetical protein